MRPTRFITAILGAILVVVFGAPLVSAIARGVAPYDLGGLSVATLPERFGETAPLIVFALGLVALGAATVRGGGRAWTASAGVLTALLLGALLVLDHGSPAWVTALRLGVIGGAAIVLTALVAVTSSTSRALHPH